MVYIHMLCFGSVLLCYDGFWSLCYLRKVCTDPYSVNCTPNTCRGKHYDDF